MKRHTINRNRRAWPLAEQMQYQRERIAAEEERIAALLQHLRQCRVARTTAKRQLSRLARH